MIDEYALVPDIFNPSAYTADVLADAYLPFLKEPLFQEAIVRDLFEGAWSKYCFTDAGCSHRLAKEILRKLSTNNRLRRFPARVAEVPANAHDWCNESLKSHSIYPLTGIIASHTTKLSFSNPEVASIEKLPGTNWWQQRSPSVTVDRKTEDYLKVLGLVFHQANSLMFIDPNLDPSSYNYRDFIKLLVPISQRRPAPIIEIHRSLCRGDGRARTFPTLDEWKQDFSSLGRALEAIGLTAEIFFWDDFHERYLITDVVGVSVPAGFDITGKTNDWSTWGRLGRDDKDKIQRLFDPAVRSDCLKWRFKIGSDAA